MNSGANPTGPLLVKVTSTTVDAAWFSGNLPVNPLLAGGHPWVEVAGESVRELTHPVRRMATGTNVAQFWYNPYKGVLRARVPADVSEATGMDLYNRVNDCDLEKLYGRVE